MPDWLAHLHLHRLLLLDAVSHFRAREIRPGLRCLDASWRLADHLRDGPLLISQLISEEVLRDQMAVLRRLAFRPPDWPARLREPTPVAHMARALWFEAWWPWAAERANALPQPVDDSGWQPLYRLVMGVMMADYAHRIHGSVSDAVTSDPVAFDPDAFFAEQFSQVPFWNVSGAILFPHVWDAWPRAHQVALDLELTDYLLDLRRQLRGASAAPSVPRGRVASAAVPGLSWDFRTEGEEVVISLVGKLLHSPPERPVLPVATRLHLPSGRASFTARSGPP